MNTSKKWLVAVGSALTLGVAAVAAHAATDEHSGAAEHMQGGMHRGMQEGKGPGTTAQRMQHMSSDKGTGHQHGTNSATPGGHRQMADAHGAGRHDSNEKHQHGQSQNTGEGKESGGHSH